MRRALVMLIACIVVGGCGGGGGSNDQGNSFRALGVFQEEEKVAPEADVFDTANPLGETGRVISLSSTAVIPSDGNGDGDLDGGYLGMRNELFDQEINVQGVNVEIFIPGALLPNPVQTDFVPLAITLGPANGDEEDADARNFAQTLFVSSDVMAFLNQNVTLLPPTPFNMNVVMSINGISDSGDSFDSNEFTYNVVVLP